MAEADSRQACCCFSVEDRMNAHMWWPGEVQNPNEGGFHFCAPMAISHDDMLPIWWAISRVKQMCLSTLLLSESTLLQQYMQLACMQIIKAKRTFQASSSVLLDHYTWIFYILYPSKNLFYSLDS